MSSFFTIPGSQRKRKRNEADGLDRKKQKSTNTKPTTKSQKSKTPRAQRDESISSSDSEDAARRKHLDDENQLSESESSDADETNAERRLRLAEQYLKNIKSEVEETVGFDAEDIDKDLIAERLAKDTADTEGRLHRFIASEFDFSCATKTKFRYVSSTTTGVATCAPYVYTVSKDLQLIKWELPAPSSPPPSDAPAPKKAPRPLPRRPKILKSTRGDRRKFNDPSYQHHTGPIICVAASPTGKYIATGGADKKLIIWSATDLTPLRVFMQHQDAVTSLAFRKGTNQLYSAAKDRKIRSWSLDEMAYLETLFGHQDEVVDVAALAMERCVSVGARDRTARLWKVAEETQLVFRGGGGGGSEKKRARRDDASSSSEQKFYSEGSIDRVAMVDEEMFVTGSDNGSLSLWSVQKKKPVFTVPLAHGLDPALKPEDLSADVVPDVKVPDRQPRGITALTTVPLSDIIVSGSWDGFVRVWRISEDKRRLEIAGILGQTQTGGEVDSGELKDGGEDEEEKSSVRGFINDLSILERGDHGKDGLSIVAATGTEPRMGRWKSMEGKSGALVFEVSRITRAPKNLGGRNEQDEIEEKT
ncbi:pre-rRNA processing protein [Lecanora helva]